MADSSPGLQSPSSNFSPEIGSHPAEAHPSTNFIGSQNEASARLASEFLAGQGQHSNTGDSLKRAAGVLAGGLADGVVDSAKHSFNFKTAETVAESLGIGYGLGALAKAGPVGQKLALAGGLVMGATWVYSELERGRPQATLSAVADAYHSSDRIAQDRQTVATNGGALAFETGLAFAAGGLGMKKGLELNTNWHVDALASVKSSYGTAVDFMARDGRVNGAHVLNDGNLGMAFAGKDSGAPAGIMSQAREIISGKEKGASSLADIQKTFAKSEAKKNDAHLLDTQGKLVELEAQHVQIRSEESVLQPKLANAVKEKTALESLQGLEQTVRSREQALTDSQQAGQNIRTKSRELDHQFDIKQAAFKKQVPVDGVRADKALIDDWNAQQAKFVEMKEALAQLKLQGSPETVQHNSESLAEARAALQQARLDQPAKVAEAQTAIDTLNDQLTALKTRRLAIEDQAKPLVDGYAARLKEITDDPTKLVQAQFEPPPEKVVAVKPAKVVPEVDLAHVDMTPEVLANVDHQLPFIETATDSAKPGATASGAATAHQEVAGLAAPPEPGVTHATDEHVTDGRATDGHATDGQPVVVTDNGQVTATAHPDHAAETGAAPVLERQATGHTEVSPAITRDHAAGRATESSAEITEPTAVSRLSKEAQRSRETALRSVKSNELVRERDTVTRVLGDIERGAYRPTNRASVPEVKADMERRLAAVNEKLVGDPAIKYTRALKSVLQYSRDISEQLAQTADATQRDLIVVQGLADVEGMMGRLPTSYKGYQGKMPDLMEPNRLGRSGSAERRFAEVSEHLEGKVALLDGSRARQITDMAERQPILNEIMRRLNASELPADGSIILMGKDGKYLGPQGGTSPYFIEVARMKANGVGADGGGFNRFEHLQNEIAGAVILRPIYENGKPVELPSRSSGGKPVYKKLVDEVVGEVPEGITVDLGFVGILRKFAPAR